MSAPTGCPPDDIDIPGLVAEGARLIRDDHDASPVDHDASEDPGLQGRADELYETHSPQLAEQLTALLRRRVLGTMVAIMMVFGASVRDCTRHGPQLGRTVTELSQSLLAHADALMDQAQLRIAALDRALATVRARAAELRDRYVQAGNVVFSEATLADRRGQRRRTQFVALGFLTCAILLLAAEAALLFVTATWYWCTGTSVGDIAMAAGVTIALLGGVVGAIDTALSPRLPALLKGLGLWGRRVPRSAVGAARLLLFALGTLIAASGVLARGQLYGSSVPPIVLGQLAGCVVLACLATACVRRASAVNHRARRLAVPEQAAARPVSIARRWGSRVRSDLDELGKSEEALQKKLDGIADEVVGKTIDQHSETIDAFAHASAMIVARHEAGVGCQVPEPAGPAAPVGQEA